MAHTAIRAEQCAFHLFQTHEASSLRNPVREMSCLPGRHYYLRKRLVFDRLRRAGLKLKAKKCKLFQKTVKFLGHVVSKEGVQCDPEKVECVQNWKIPECVTEIRSFLGLASYYKRFILEYAQRADKVDGEGQAVYLERSVPTVF